MTSNGTSEKSIGIIGAGHFGTVIANLAAINKPVLLYLRNEEQLHEILKTGQHRGVAMHPNIAYTQDIQELTDTCDVIFPVVPSVHFRSVIQKFAPHLKPHHILIHGTKGLDVSHAIQQNLPGIQKLNRSQVKTMSEVIREETCVVRIGCLAGPNLSKELAARHPAATVIASRFHEVFQTGKKILRSERFQVYENSDIIGIELAGVLKNIFAIAAGALHGLGYGDNAKGLLISRGAVEMVYLGRAMGGELKSFLGVAGIGDLVTTCNSSLSRNFTVGTRLAKGETLEQIMATSSEVAEGINTIRIMKKCADYYGIKALITDRLYKVLFENVKVEEALEFLMRFPLSADIDFI